MKDFINIKPEFTLDKGIDNSSPKARQNSFTTLSNYIPEQGCIATRGGIDEFDFTDEAYDPSSDCLIWTRFETSPTLIDDKIQGASFWTVTAGNTYSASGTKKEGSGSLYIDYFVLPGGGLNKGFYNEKASLPATFPGMGDGPHNFIASMWFYPTWRDANTLWFQRLVPQFEGGWEIRIISAAGSYQFRGTITDSAGNSRIITAGDSMWSGRWYHIALWSSTNVGNSGMVIWDDLGSTEYTYSPAVPIVCGGWDTASATTKFTVGTYRSGRAYFDSMMVRVGDLVNEQAFLEKIRDMRNVT